MTLQQLKIERDNICSLMIECEGDDLRSLERELFWIEELIEEMENNNGEE